MPTPLHDAAASKHQDLIGVLHRAQPAVRHREHGAPRGEALHGLQDARLVEGAGGLIENQQCGILKKSTGCLFCDIDRAAGWRRHDGGPR